MDIEGTVTHAVQGAQRFAKYELHENTLIAWGSAAGLALGVFVLALLIRSLFVRKLTAIAEAHPGTVFWKLAAGFAEATTRLGLLVLSIVAAAQLLELNARAEKILGLIGSVTVVTQLALWATSLLNISLPLYLKKRTISGMGASAIALLEFSGTCIIWTFAVLLVLENIGVDITALIAGLGIGGIAIALAVQNILGDLLSSLSIVLDKPFEVGDVILTGDFVGTVERVGIKTTRLRSVDGEQIVIANSDLLRSRIRNFKRMYERRVLFSLAVSYETPTAVLKEIPTIIRTAIESRPNVRFDRAHLKSFGESALIFETVYFVSTPEYSAYMDTQQAITLELLDVFAERKIEIAYPTQNLRMKRVG